MPQPGEFKDEFEGKTFLADAKPIYITREPIIKVVKQPVIITQPVIIHKQPEIIKKEEVTIKHKPAYVEHKKDPKITYKDLSGGKPKVDIPEYPVEPIEPEMKDIYELKPDYKNEYVPGA